MPPPCPPRTEARPDVPPERREELPRIGSSGTRIAEDDEHDDGQADPDGAGHHEQGHGEGSGGEDHERAEQPELEGRTGKGMQDRTDDDGSGHPGHQRVDGDRPEAQRGPSGVGRP